jgi:hypothetical protein
VNGPRRHPADITAGRLLTHYERWFDRYYGNELVAISTVRAALQRIAEEDQGLASDDDEDEEAAAETTTSEGGTE